MNCFSTMVSKAPQTHFSGSDVKSYGMTAFTEQYIPRATIRESTSVSHMDPEQPVDTMVWRQSI